MESDSEEPENICPICMRGFSTLAGVRVHWRVHSAELIEAAISNQTQSQFPTTSGTTAQKVVPDDFRCFECGFDAQNEQNYVVHVRTHLMNSTIPTDATSFQSSTTNRAFMEYMAKLKQSYHLIKCIPKRARHIVANDFSKLIESCISTNDTSHWRNLLVFAHKTLRLPVKKEGVSLSQVIKNNAASTLNGFTGIRTEAVKQAIFIGLKQSWLI